MGTQDQVCIACTQAAAQADKHNALAKLAEVEGVLQQALHQHAQASAQAQTHLAQLRQKNNELNSVQQQLQQRQQEMEALQVADCSTPLLQKAARGIRQTVYLSSCDESICTAPNTYSFNVDLKRRLISRLLLYLCLFCKVHRTGNQTGHVARASRAAAAMRLQDCAWLWEITC